MLKGQGTTELLLIMSCGKECHVGHVGLFWSAVPNCDPKAISLFPQIWGPKQLIMNHTHVDTWP